MPPDIDQILEAIRAEARARGAKGRIGTYGAESGPNPAGPAVVHQHGLQRLTIEHVADLLPLPLDEFIREAYRHLLGREPDGSGLTHYQRCLLRGKLTRIEVLGRLALSPEGRRRATPLRGLLPAFALATGYRIPLAGPLAAFLSRALCLPAAWQDRRRIEAMAHATGAWMKR